jgi:hypothetical protein
MASGYQRFLSGLGDAEDSVLSTDESAAGGAGGAGDASADGGSGAPTSSGPGWGSVLTATASALPVIAKEAAGAYRTYEESHGGIAHAGSGQPAAGGGGGARASAPSKPWYESTGFLVVAGLGLGLVIVLATRRK